MSNPGFITDVRMQLYFEPFDGQDHAPDGPGWYVAATRMSGADLSEIIPRVRLSNDEALKLASIADELTTGKPLNWNPNLTAEDISLEQAVAEATKAGTEIVRTELAYAEQAVERLANLRRRALEFGIESKT
jgi:hypothetical protein